MAYGLENLMDQYTELGESLTEREKYSRLQCDDDRPKSPELYTVELVC